MKILIFAIGICVTQFALGHGTEDFHGLWWSRWNNSWIIITNLTLVSALYLKGWIKRKKRFPLQKKISNRQGLFFSTGLFFLIITLLSPLDTYSEELGWVHMLQHTGLMMIAAPFIAMSSMGYVSQWFLPPKFWRWSWLLRKRIRHKMPDLRVKPMAVIVLYALTLWIWHLPALYEAALNNKLLHDLQHLTFFLTSTWFWILLLDPYSKKTFKPEVGILYLFVTSLHAMILGVLMALSPVVWYKPYLATAPRFGLSALQDQNLAGLIMWMPAGTTYVAVAVFLFIKLIARGS